jgi:hypothetical protein
MTHTLASKWRLLSIVLSCDGPNTVDVVVVAVEEGSEEFWWVMVSCSPPARGGEHVEIGEKLELKVFEQRQCLGSHETEELVDRSIFLQGLRTLGHSFHSLRLRV